MKLDDRSEYERMFGIVHSDCYEMWGFTRTGCVGCPFNRNLDNDLDAIGRNEPNMAIAARKVFADAYEYTRMYRDFRADAIGREHGLVRIPGL